MSTMHVNGSNRRVELYVRSLAPASAHCRLESVLDRLEQLESNDRIAEYTVHVWGSRFDPSAAAAATEAGQFVQRRITEFTTWFEQNGLSTDPFFREETIRSQVTDEEHTAIALPTMTVAEYEDGELVHVVPCSDGETARTVDDRLEQLGMSNHNDSTPASGRSSEDELTEAASEPI